LPNNARAAATLPSSPPMCTPSAPTAAASAASSLTMKVVSNARVSSRRALACCSFSEASADLLRYCRMRAPPRKACSTWLSSLAVSGSSGVIA